MSTDDHLARDDYPDLLVRGGTPDDAEVLAGLFVAARDAAYPAMPRPVHTPREIRSRLARLVEPDEARETWVAERDDAVVGFLVLTPEWLDSLYVRPDLTGQGIGTALLDVARSLRPGGFGLWVFESNRGAQRFYARRGLITLERTDGRDNEERAPDVAMAWPGQDPLAYLRRQIDAVDTDLGKALSRRAALTAAVQHFKPVPGHEGRDLSREAEIAARLGAIAPNLGPARIQRIIHAVISESLDAAGE